MHAGSADDAVTFRSIYPSLRRFAAVVGPLEDEPDDLLQEAVARTLRRTSLSALDDPERYLQTVMIRLASNRRRALGTMRRALARAGTPTVTAAAAAEFPSDVADLFHLPPQTRALLFLVEVEGWPFRDAARVVGCTEEAARARASRALRQLRAELIEEAR
ncbi:MAG TPA: sigma factor-like helix-turn-helix DNA-binding protein [Acidimicrobiales bacterium]